MRYISLLFFALVWCGSVYADDFVKERHAMVEKQIAGRNVTDQRVLEAMRNVPRHFFVRPEDIHRAYSDRPLYIAEGQTISQPYIVALMTELMNLKGGERVLEIGTGSGYQAAVLSHLCKEVYSIEIIKSLYQRAAHLFQKGGYKNIYTHYGDGYAGWKEKATFDAIMITAAADYIPPPLVEQLKDGGVLVLPLKDKWFSSQTLTVVTKKGGKLDIREVIPVIFVPMTGKIKESKPGRD